MTGTQPHPALRVWRKLHSGCAEPEAIETLKQKNKSAIYRLCGIGPSGSSIIAKRCLCKTAVIEQTIYREVLPRLPVPALQFYGCVADEDTRFTWTFLEDAGSSPYRTQDLEHQTLLVEWLAALHTRGTVLRPESLPARGPEHYLGQLRSAKVRILSHASNPVLTQEESDPLERILGQCDFLESKWRAIEELCKALPQTIVHGDLKEKNIRVSHRSDGVALLIFDWEAAGWGAPGPDLWICPRLKHYYERVRNDWPTMSLGQIEEMAHLGILFRTLAAIDWEAWRLEFENVERPIGNMRDFYLPQLNEAIQALDLQ